MAAGGGGGGRATARAPRTLFFLKTHPHTPPPHPSPLAQSTLETINGIAAYANTRETIVNLLLATVVLSCIYYFSVVIFEISSLVSESRRAKLQKLSSGPRKGGLGGDGEARRGLHEDELTAGGTDVALNPMLIKDGQLNLGKKKGERPGLTEEVRQFAEGFIAHEGRLPSELWPAFQATFAALNTANGAVSAAIAASKKRTQEIRLGMGGKRRGASEAGAEGAGAGAAAVPAAAGAAAAPAAAGSAAAGAVAAVAAAEVAPAADVAASGGEAGEGAAQPELVGAVSAADKAEE